MGTDMNRRSYRVRRVVRFFIRYFPDSWFIKYGKYFAHSYANMAERGIADFYQKVAEEIAAEIEHGNILDVGTGPGYLPIEIVKKSENIRAIGLDISEKVIMIAQRNVREAGLSDRIDLIIGDGNSLGLKEDSFEMVVSTGVLFLHSNPIKMMSEFYRVLKHGREAWTYDFHRDLKPEEVKLLNNRAHGTGVSWLWRLLTKSAIKLAYTVDEFSEMAVKTAFKGYEIERKRIGILPLMRVRLKKH